jgi:hypothetical protein
MRAEFIVDPLQMAIARRRPQAGLVHHSDSEYVRAGCPGGLTRTGNMPFLAIFGKNVEDA